MITFDRPLLLLALPVALVVLWFGQRGSLVAWTLLQRRWCAGIRAGLVTLIALACAGPQWTTSTRDVAVAFVLDESASVSQDGIETARQRISRLADAAPARTVEVGFGAEPKLVRPAGKRERENPEVDPRGSDLAAAVQFAAGLLPGDRPGRIVLFTDGRDTTTTRVHERLAALAAAGVGVDLVALEASVPDDASIRELLAPADIREGEVFDATVTVDATVPAAGVMRVFQNEVLTGEIPVTLAPGVNRVTIPGLLAEGRFGVCDVELAVTPDATPENNFLRAAFAHGGSAKVLLVDNDATQAALLASALRRERFEVEIRPAAGFPTEAAALEAFDLVVFSDVPAAAFSTDQLRLLTVWVRDGGGGFLMVGGENSFGSGGYFATPVAEILPVVLERENREESPVSAILVVLDRSGSMSAPAGARTKMALANEGAALALDVLQPNDFFGVFAVDTRVQEVVPLTTIADKSAAVAKIAGITAGGGGIYVFTALAAALPRLAGVDARIKHVIFFCDAADAEEKSSGEASGQRTGSSALDLASAMLAGRITISVVALGNEDDRDTAFLRQLAARGGGRFYLTADATTLPRLFALETLRATQSSLQEEPFLAVPNPAAPDVVGGIDWETAPLLLGLNLTRLKPTAEWLLRSDRGDVLFAMWQQGTGKVGVFTSDARGRWAAEWLGWDGFGKFWSQVARAVIRSSQRRDLDVNVTETNGRLRVSIDATTPSGEFRNGLDVRVAVAPESGQARSVPAPQIAPGRYEVELPRPSSKAALILVNDGAGRPASVAWSGGASREFTREPLEPDLARNLADAASGMLNPTDTEIFRPAVTERRNRMDLAPWILAVALLLLPVDIWLRRRDWGEKSLPVLAGSP